MDKHYPDKDDASDKDGWQVQNSKKHQQKKKPIGNFGRSLIRQNPNQPPLTIGTQSGNIPGYNTHRSYASTSITSITSITSVSTNKTIPQSLNLASVHAYPELRTRGQVWYQKSLHPFAMYNLPEEILALIASFFWTTPSESIDNLGLSFIDETLAAGKIICLMLKLGLCSTSLSRFVSQKYPAELTAIRKTLTLNFIQKLSGSDIDMENGFDGHVVPSSPIYRQVYPLRPKIPLKKVFDCLKTDFATDTDYANLFSKIWYVSCIYDYVLTMHLSRSLTQKKSTKEEVVPSESKYLTKKHIHNGFKLSICAGQWHTADYLLTYIIDPHADVILDGLCASVKLMGNQTCRKISEFIARFDPKNFLSDRLVKKFFASCTWTEKNHIENLYTVAKELGVLILFRLGKSVDEYVWNSDCPHFFEIIKSAVKFDCEGLIQLIVEAADKLLAESKLGRDNFSKMTFKVYNSHIIKETLLGLDAQQLFLLCTILKEGILSACDEGNAHMFRILNPEKMIVESELYEYWKAVRNGKACRDEEKRSEGKKSDIVRQSELSRLILDLFSITNKLTCINFNSVVSSNLTKFIFNTMCCTPETMNVLLYFPGFDISFSNFELIHAAVKLSQKKIIERIFHLKDSRIDRFFNTINYYFFNKFKYSREEPNDLEIFRMFLSDPRMRLIEYLEQQFDEIFCLEEAIPYTLTIIQTPHLQFELYFGEFIGKHSLETAPKEIISALVCHKKIRQLYDFESMMRNLSSDANPFVMKNLEIMLNP